VFFSWVCMFYRFSLFVIRFPRHRDVLRSLSLSLLCRSFSEGGSFSYFPVNSAQ
jgi:hypothetical protein